ncbi:hypothetical protein [Flavobacterium suncheonense]|nr:hypothetical protein [Flavobacterium suncheonense]
MKKILLLLVFFFAATANMLANEYIINIETARKFKQEADYKMAVKYYLKALKEKENEKETAQAICYEISDCFFESGDERSALKFVKAAVKNYGATIENLTANAVLKKDFMVSVKAVMVLEYHELHRAYLLKNRQFDQRAYAELMR